MSITWHQIHEHLMHSSYRFDFQQDFNAIRRRRPELAAFADPAALLDTLHGSTATSQAKNGMLTALVREAQSENDTADVALALMLLVLWPGLDAIRRRLKSRGIGSLDDLPSDILFQATAATRCLDLARVNRIAATVLRNIERDLMRAHRREVGHQQVHAEIDPDDVTIEDQGWATTCLQHLNDDLVRMIGSADASIVMRVAVEGLTQSELAGELGLTEAAARKRYQRARLRLREELEDLSEPMSRMAGANGFPYSTAPVESPMQ